MKKFKLNKFLIGAGILAISIATFIFVFSNLPNKNNYMDKINNLKGSSLASMEVYADSVDELNDLSDLIIEGKVVDYEPKISYGMVFTNETIEVKKVIKGNVKEGDKINVVFTGGELNGMATPPIKDCPIMDMRGNYMLFLKTNNGVSYFIIGGNQGYGLIKNNKIEVTDKGEMGDIFRSYNVDEMEKNIKYDVSTAAKQ